MIWLRRLIGLAGWVVFGFIAVYVLSMMLFVAGLALVWGGLAWVHHKLVMRETRHQLHALPPPVVR